LWQWCGHVEGDRSSGHQLVDVRKADQKHEVYKATKRERKKGRKEQA